MKWKVLLAFIALAHTTIAFADREVSFWDDTQEGRRWSKFDFLFWKANEDAVVLTNETSPLFTTTDFTQTPVLHPKFNWDVGFRIAAGISPPCSDFEVIYDWIFYYTEAHQARHTDSNDLTNVNGQEGMFPIWALSEDIIAGDYVAEAHLDWQIFLTVFDWTFAKTWFLCDTFDLHPYAGLRFAYINQNVHIDYAGGIFLYNILNGGISRNGIDKVRMESDFIGLGPRIGIAPRVSLCYGLSLFGDAAISGLGGVFYIDQNERFINEERFDYDKTTSCIRAISDLAAGLAWDKSFCDDKLHFRCQLSWEYHVFFSQMKFQRDAFDLVPSNNNLSVQGVTLSFSFGY